MQDRLLFTSLAGTITVIASENIISFKVLKECLGLTVLCYYNRNGNIYIMHKMMQHGTDLKLVDEQGKTSLLHAVSGGSV